MSRKRRCPMCLGNGKVFSKPMKDLRIGDSALDEESCPTCNGTGWFRTKPLPKQASATKTDIIQQIDRKNQNDDDLQNHGDRRRDSGNPLYRPAQ